MADYAELADLVVAQPVALQRPYAADPGTLTGWLVKDTIGASSVETLRILAATNAKYANVTATDVEAEAATNILKEMAEDIFASEALETFLTVVIPEGGESTVMVVSRMSRYRAELGVVSPWTGEGFGFLGEVEGGQLPPLVKLPDALSLRQALAPKELLVPTWTEWNAHFGVNPREVRIRGEELMTIEGRDAETGRRVWVPKLQYIPRAWAPYFFGGTTPEYAMRLIRQLILDLDTVQQQETAGSLERWCAASCVRSGIVGNLRSRSKNWIAWLSPAGALDRELTRWSARKMAPYLAVSAALPPGMAAMFPPLAAVDGRAAAPVPMMGALPGYESGNRDKVYSPFEHERIRTACGLSHANYEASRPPIYAAMLTEGRTMAKVEAVLQRYFAPDPMDWDPVKIYVSAELTRDLKDLRFGYGNENTYDTCHRGISPFAVLQVSMEQQNKRRKIQERADRATHLSTDDVREMEAEPGSCPSTYFSMLSLLRKYIRLLTVLFGPGCAHLAEVQGVYQILSAKSAVYEKITADLVAETLWHVFIDAREYFSYTGPGLPDSQLFAFRDCLRSCSLKVTINCPTDLLLGRPSPSVAPVVSRTSSAGGGRSRASGGSASTMSTLTGSAAVPRGTPEMVGGKWMNPTPIPEIVSIMADFRARKPGVDMYTLMRSQKLLMSDVGIGGRGQCMDFMYFGECGRTGCTYSHIAGAVSSGKRRDVIKKMTKAVAGYLAEETGA
jgi:hypothetical protein